MTAHREPRRIARQTWATDTHLGELDADVDELHNLRAMDRDEYQQAQKRLESKMDRLIMTAYAAAITGATMAFGLIGNIILKTLT